MLNKITESSPRSKLYNFCIIKINLLLRKITLLLSASIFGPTLAPQLKIHRWCVVEVPTLGQQQYFTCCNFSVGPMSARQQWHYPTLTQRLLAIWVLTFKVYTSLMRFLQHLVRLPITDFRIPLKALKSQSLTPLRSIRIILSYCLKNKKEILINCIY